MQDENTERIFKVVGNITESAERQTLDDGISQGITTKQGIGRVGVEVIPNPVTLRPFRTFSEIEQPASSFVLRLNAGRDGESPKVALFEADGAKWQNDAMGNIKEYLSETGVVILA